MEELRPRFCTQCGQLARDGALVWVQGHGCYSRQVRGLCAGWVVIWVRRYVCRNCGHTMSRLPDWLHPWRWYAATVMVEALYRHLMLGETARDRRKVRTRPGYAGVAQSAAVAGRVVGVADVVVGWDRGWE